MSDQYFNLRRTTRKLLDEIKVLALYEHKESEKVVRASSKFFVETEFYDIKSFKCDVRSSPKKSAHQVLFIDLFEYHCECKHAVEKISHHIHVIAAIKTALDITKRDKDSLWL